MRCWRLGFSIRACLTFTVSTMPWATMAWASSHTAKGYLDHPRAEAFITEMIQEHNVPRQQTEAILKQAKHQTRVLELIQKPYEKTHAWHDYRSLFLQPKRINAGKRFMNTYKVALERAEFTYGIPSEVIAAIIGVETYYGAIMGTYPVLDALATLAFDYPKRPLFWRELKAYLLMVQEENFKVDQLKGSYAGAMGYGQFIPSSFRAYAVDFDGDGKKDIWKNPVDAIGSVANYLSQHGWQKNAPVLVSAEFKKSLAFNVQLKPHVPLKTIKSFAKWPGEFQDTTLVALLEYQQPEYKETMLGFKNFYVITRYNHSRLYARAVFDLSQALIDNHPVQVAQPGA